MNFNKILQGLSYVAIIGVLVLLYTTGDPAFMATGIALLAWIDIMDIKEALGIR